MSSPDQYRAEAAEFTELARAGNAPDEVREFQKRERSFTALADNLTCVCSRILFRTRASLI
jgi:hypothetical protein